MFFPLVLIAFCLHITEGVTFTAFEVDNAPLTNPGRGFYHYTETSATSYTPLDLDTLVRYRTEEQITIILRLVYLDSFVDDVISPMVLVQLGDDFDTLRAAGLKCILRFAYTSSDDTPYGDATLARVTGHIKQLKLPLDAGKDVILVVQAGFIGTWGEWYYSDNFGNTSEWTSQNWKDRGAVVTALLAAVPDTLMIQLRTPNFKRTILSRTEPITAFEAFGTSAVARIGYHNDCWLASSTDFGTFVDVDLEYPYLTEETTYVAMGGETCAVSNRSNCNTALDELFQFHWSYLNADYNPKVLSSWDSCMVKIKNSLGYRYEIQKVTFSTLLAESSGQMSLFIKNTGAAAVFNAYKVDLILRCTYDGSEYTIPLDIDPRTWLGNATTRVETDIFISGIPAGSYVSLLHIHDANPKISERVEYSIRLANAGTWEQDTGYNSIGMLQVGDSGISLSPSPTHTPASWEYWNKKHAGAAAVDSNETCAMYCDSIYGPCQHPGVNIFLCFDIQPGGACPTGTIMCPNVDPADTRGACIPCGAEKGPCQNPTAYDSTCYQLNKDGKCPSGTILCNGPGNPYTSTEGSHFSSSSKKRRRGGVLEWIKNIV